MDNTQPSFPANTIPEVQSAPVDYQPDAPAPEKTEPVGDYSPSTNALSDEAIANRAPKYHLAMGASSPGVESISARLASGADESIRQDQVTRNELEFQKTKLDVISSLIKNSPEGANADDAEFVRNLPQAALEHSTDPRIVMETSYAKKLLQAVLVHDEQQNFAKVETVNPEEANQKLDVAEYAASRTQIAQSALEDLHNQMREQGWGGFVGDIVGSSLPLAAVRLNNLTKEAPATSLLPGNNMQEQISYLHSLPPSEFSKELNEALENIGNLQLREQFLTAVIQQSDNDRFFTNAMTAVDAATVAESAVAIGKGIKGAVTAIGKTAEKTELSQALESTLQSGVAAGKAAKPDPVVIAGQTGNTRMAAVLNAIRDAIVPPRGEEQLRLNARSISDPMSWFNGEPVDYSKPNIQEFSRMAKSNAELAEDILSGPQVERGASQDMLGRVQAVYDRFIGGNPKSISGAVVDVDANALPTISGTGNKFAVQKAEGTLTNTEALRVTFGRQNGEGFPNKAMAVRFAKNNLSQYQLDITGRENSNVFTHAGKWYVRIDHDVPDVLDNFKNAEIPINDKFNEGFWNGTLRGFLGSARNQSNVLGQANSDARKVVVHGSQRLFEAFREILKPIASLDKESRQKLGTILELNRNYVDRETGQRGMFFETHQDFVQAYHSKFGVLPSDKVTKAYYSYVQANQLDGMVRNAGWARDKIRLGIKNYTDTHTIKYKDDGSNKFSQKWKPIEFEGKRVGSIPWDDGHNTHIAVRNSDTGEVTVFSKRFATKDQKALIEKELRNNGRIIQAADGHLPIEGVDKDATVSHYVTGSAKEGRVKVNGPWKDGGHVINEQKWYIKQPQARGDYFAGDLTIASAPNEALAKQWAQDFDQARLMMHRGDPALDAFVSDRLGLTQKEFLDKFSGQRTADGIDRQGLSKDQPILHVRSGEQTIDRHKTGLKQGENPYNLLDLDRRFAGERDSYNIPALISEKGNTQHIADGRLVDPYEALTEAAKSMVDVRLKRDYVLKSAQQWAQQFRDILSPADPTKGEASVAQLYNPQYLASVDKILLNNAENARKSILRFSGMLNKDERALETLKGKMAEIVYGAIGDKKYQVAENWLLPYLKDPAQTARSFAFHLKMGLFSPMHLFLQASTIVNVAAISPKAALKGIPAYYPLRVAIINPNMLEHSVSVAAKFGWKPEEFREMYNSLMHSGWAELHGDNAILNDISNPGLFKSGLQKTLDAGAVLSDEGIKIHRIAAWATSYQEWRAANPGAKLTRKVEQDLLSRSDNMTANMSAANNANWQRGLMSVPAQFFTFQLRTMEQYVGKTLTTAEKSRLFATQAAMFGFPTAIGGAVGVWPVADSVKDYLTSNNIPHDNAAVDSLLNGIPQMMLKLATGTEFDVGQRFGPGGIDLGYQLMNGEKTASDLIFGASGSVIGDVVSTSVPLVKSLWSLTSDDPSDKLYPLDLITLERALQNVTSANIAIKLGYAINTGRWMSKHGIAQDDVTPFQAIFMSLTGASMTEINELYRQDRADKNMSTLARHASQEVQDYLTRGMNEEDDKQREEYFKVAKAHAVAGHLTPQEWQQTLLNALKGIETTRKDATAQKFNKDLNKRKMLQ